MVPRSVNVRNLPYIEHMQHDPQRACTNLPQKYVFLTVLWTARKEASKLLGFHVSWCTTTSTSKSWGSWYHLILFDWYFDISLVIQTKFLWLKKHCPKMAQTHLVARISYRTSLGTAALQVQDLWPNIHSPGKPQVMSIRRHGEWPSRS